MSITIRDALQIGGLVDAKVLAGEAGLDNIIRAVDIIDVPDAAIWFRKDSLLSTTFYALKDNIEAQLQMLEDITACGGSGLIIFSPERYISAIDDRLVKKAEELALPLLQMPDCSYIDVIVPVMTVILDKQVKALEYAHEVHNQMTSIVLKGKGLKELIFSLSNLIKHPVFMADAACEMLDFAIPKGLVFDIPMINYLEKRHGYLELADCYPQEVLHKLLHGRRPFYHRAGGGNLSLDFLFPIVAGDNFFGVLIVPNLEGELEKAKTVALEAGSMAISLDILKERAVKDAKKKMELNFFNELLLGNIKSKENIIAQAQRFGLDIEGSYALLLVELNKESPYYRKLIQFGREGEKEKIEQKLLRLLKVALDMEHAKSIVVEALGSMAVMIKLPEKWSQKEKTKYSNGLMRKIKKSLEIRMEGIPTCMAMGNIYENIEKISSSYLEAWETLDIGKKLLSSDFAVTYADMEAYHLVKRFISNTNATNVYYQVYDKLLNYDREKGGELVYTLEAYIACNYSKSKTAERLHIHRNSLNYRLQKIEEILGRDVDEIDSFPFLLASISHKLSP